MGRGPGAGARRGGAVAGLPGAAAAVDPLDGQSAAAAVRPARRRHRPARAARPGRGLGRHLHPAVRRPRSGRGAPAHVRGRDPGRVLARLLRLLVGGRSQPARPVTVPYRGARRVRGGRRSRRRLGPAAGTGRRKPRAGRTPRRAVARHPGRPALRGRPRGRRHGHCRAARRPRARRRAAAATPAWPRWTRPTGSWSRRGGGTRTSCSPSGSAAAPRAACGSPCPGTCRCRRW